METNFSRWNLNDLNLRIREDENDQENGMTFSSNRLQNDRKNKFKRKKTTAPGNVLSHLLSNDSSIHCLELSRFAEFYTDVLTGSLSECFRGGRYVINAGKLYSNYSFITCT